jgi:nucleoside-diphosphate-sugar epimerase
MKVCVTGGRGFIGSRLIEALVQEGHAVVSISRHEIRNRAQEVVFHQGDLLNEDCPLDAFVSGCDVLVNCAGELEDTAVMKKLHVEGTRRLLQAVGRESERTGKKIHWVQLSSVGVYGPPVQKNRSRIVTEESAPAPVGEYEITKYLSDKLVLEAARSELITCSILRPSNVIGPDMPNQSLAGLISFVRKQLFFYIGRPGAIATYVHVDDVVAALIRCGIHPKARNGDAFNLSNDCDWEEVINAIADACGLKRPTLRLPESMVRFLVKLLSPVFRVPLTQTRIDAFVARTAYPTTKITNLLDFRPNYHVPKAIRKLV